MEKQLKYYYSLVTGQIEPILPEEVKTLEVYQIPLNKKPRENCNKCYGRAVSQYDVKNSIYVPCSCVRKVIDTENYKNGEISFYIPKLSDS